MIYYCRHYRSDFWNDLERMPLNVLGHIQCCIVPPRLDQEGEMIDRGNVGIRIEVSRMWRRQHDAIEPKVGMMH